MKGKRIT